MKHIIRSIKFMRPIVVLAPKMNAKYEGVTNMGKYAEFDNGYAELDEEEFDLLKQNKLFGIEYVEVNERGIPSPTPGTPTVKAVDALPEDNKGNKLVELEKTVNQLTEVVKVLANTMAEKKLKDEENNELDSNEPEQPRRGRPPRQK